MRQNEGYGGDTVADIRGRFLWYDCMTPDVEAAKTFYTAVTGWGIQAWEMPGQVYNMWTAGGRPIGGVLQTPSGAQAPPHWMGHVGTPDVRATTARAEALGAKILVKPTVIPAVGAFSVIADPQGAVIAAFTPDNPQPEEAASPAMGDFMWHELATTDVSAALAFYGELFGWTAGNAMDMGPAGVYQVFKRGEKELGGMFIKPNAVPAAPHWLYYTRVPNLEAALAKVTAGGGRVVMGPHQVPGGAFIAMCVDPQGGHFALLCG